MTSKHVTVAPRDRYVNNCPARLQTLNAETSNPDDSALRCCQSLFRADTYHLEVFEPFCPRTRFSNLLQLIPTSVYDQIPRKMRMTRAALRAAAQIGEIVEAQYPGEPSIHEDVDGEQENIKLGNDSDNDRPALRDITDDNYPRSDKMVQAKDFMTTNKHMKDVKQDGKMTDTMIEKSNESLSNEEDLTSEREFEEGDTTASKNEVVTENEKVNTPHSTEHSGSQLSKISVEHTQDQGVESIIHETMEHATIEDAGAAMTPIRNTHMNITAKTPKFDPTIHTSTADDCFVDARTPVEDSFVAAIKTRSPVKMDLHQSPLASVGLPGSPDSFVGSIKSRTPMRSSSRIEDSVEAIDDLEDALEQISTELPMLQKLTIEKQINTTVKTPVKTPARVGTRVSARKAAATPSQAKTISSIPTSTKKSPSAVKKDLSLIKNVAAPVTTRKAAVVSNSTANFQKRSPTLVASKTTVATSKGIQIKTTTSRLTISKPMNNPSLHRKSMAPSRMVTSIKSESSTSSRPDLSFSNSPVNTQPNVVKKRVPSATLSTSKPGFVPSKSTKPTTKANFSLPGDAISAKVKAQREEKLKQEEEAEKARKQFKARPAPSHMTRPSINPKDNRASQARMSVMTNISDKENVSPNIQAPVVKPRSTTLASKSSTEETSSNTSTKANSKARRATESSSRPPPSTTELSGPSHQRVVSLSQGKRLTITKQDLQQQKVRGREVFDRVKIETENIEKDKKEREEAAKKARAEAAERGRLASREWAEKKKREQLRVAAASRSEGSTAIAGGILAGPGEESSAVQV